MQAGSLRSPFFLLIPNSPRPLRLRPFLPSSQGGSFHSSATTPMAATDATFPPVAASSPPSPPAHEILWQPSPALLADANLTRYTRWLAQKTGRQFDDGDYAALWEWSVNDLAGFWSSIADFFGVRFHQPATVILRDGAQMPGARWFPGATLNYAEHALLATAGAADGDTEKNPALLFATEPGDDGRTPWRERTLSRAELRREVAAVADALRRLGVQKGDRVVGYLPNIPQTVVAFLAAASLGAVWSGCPPELSARGVLDRFAQIEPTVLFAVDGYRYGGKSHDRAAALAEIVAGLPTLRAVVLVPWLRDAATARDEVLKQSPVPVTLWDDRFVHEPPPLRFEPVAFEHPLWILYSSGTTGQPKAIVQGHGGILLEHLKALSLHLDLRAGDRFLWFTTAGWMMWNMLVSGLLLPGVTVVLYDGSPKQPDLGALWRFVAAAGVTFFGTSAPFLLACMKENLTPGADCDLRALRAIGSTGAPLPPEGFRWVYDQVKRDLLLGSASGGTDVCTAFVLACPWLPVRAGELPCRGLGARIESWDEHGRPHFDQVGELVLTAPFPSMPVFFWNDPDGRRLRASYFDTFPGIWRHGDWIEIKKNTGACVIYGRSDSTLNRGGVRMGTSEFYRVVEDLAEVQEALVIDTGGLGREDKLLLFVVLRAGCALDDATRAKINAKLRAEISPRHVPDAIFAVAEIPHTLNGKKLEVPVKRILAGMPLEKAVSREAVANPAALEPFVALAAAGG